MATTQSTPAATRLAARSARPPAAKTHLLRDGAATAAAAAFDRFLSELRARVEPLEIAMNDAWWQANTSGSDEDAARSAEAQKRITRVYSDPNAFAYLQSVDEAGLPPDLARQHALLLNTFAANQMDDAVIEEMVDTEKSVEADYNNFRPDLCGEPATDNRLRDVLRDSDDVNLRREAWHASKQIGARVAERVLRLVRLRNREARRLGYANYYALSLTLQELDQNGLFALLGDVHVQTEPAWTAYKSALDARLAARFHVSPADLRPWHYGDPFFQEAPAGDVNLDAFFAGKDLPAITARFFAAVGLPIDDLLPRADLFEREGKNQHAFCLHVGRFGDVRVLCNVTATERWMGTLLHEFGHAVYEQHIGDDLPFFLREPAHTLTTEAVAMLMGRLSRDADWLVRYAAVSPDDARQAETSARGEASAQLLLMARWCLVMTHFERALYENPDRPDLHAFWWQLVHRFQGVNPPAGRDNAPDWAAKIHLALAPAYYHNYLLGEMFASQLQNHIQQRVLPAGTNYVSSPLVGDYLRRAVFAPGARSRWDERIEAATGEPLRPEHFVRQLSS